MFALGVNVVGVDMLTCAGMDPDVDNRSIGSTCSSKYVNTTRNRAHGPIWDVSCQQHPATTREELKRGLASMAATFARRAASKASGRQD